MATGPTFGVMYHLTGSRPAVWRRDFDALAHGGFHRVVLFDHANNIENIRTALDLCAERNLRGYSILFNPIIMVQALAGTKYDKPKYYSVGIDGQTLAFHNPFDPVCRRGVIKPFFNRVIQGLGQHPALAGYFIDDTLDAPSMISYTPGDAQRFRRWVKIKYKDNLDRVARAWRQPLKRWNDIAPPRIMRPWSDGWQRMWDDWCKARQQWWCDWSDDILPLFRRVKGTQCILGDDWYSLRFGRDVAGGFTPKMARKFDAFSFDYTAAIDYLDPKLTNIDRDLDMTRDLVGKLPMTVFLKAAAAADQPMPDMKSVIRQTRRCLRHGADGIDYYIYRAAPENYAHKNCLANHPKAFKELASFIKRA